MRNILKASSLNLVLLAVCAGLAAQSQPQQETAGSTSSLADYARRTRVERAQGEKRPVRVFTNDDVRSLPPAANPVQVISRGSAAANPTLPAASSKPGVERFRKAMADARAKLENHQRELEVLKQKLSQNQMQYYPDPSKALNEQYTRSDVTKLTGEVQSKQQEIDEDRKAIEDLEDQFRRQGGDPGTIREAQSAPVQAEPTLKEPADLLGSGPESPGGAEGTKKGSEDKKKTKEYWQSRFKIARGQLAQAEEQQKLVQDELNLLRIQQARELDPSVQDTVKNKIAEKTVQLEKASAVAVKAQKILEALEAEFATSGAPEDWKS